ncbi:MAG: hypothetical protein HHJ11_07950 [Phycicoccus sp.]|nr:hypothetical protein [Phycicoccus sp.]
MTNTRSMVAATLAVAAIAATSACTANDPKPTPSTTTSVTSTATTPTPSSTSLSPAEQDLKDAAQTITRFWGVLDALASDQKKSLDELATVSRDQAIAQWRSNLTSYRRSGWKQVGDSTVLSAEAQAVGGKNNFAVKACIDVSKANVVDPAGKSVIAAGRQDRMQYTYKVQKAPGGFFVTEDKLKGQPC